MTFSLSTVRFSESWKWFFMSLPGWREISPGEWRGSGAAASIPPGCAETIAILEVSNRLEGTFQVRASADHLTRTPLPRRRRPAAFGVGGGCAALNHIAIDIPGSDTTVAASFHGDDVVVFLPKAARYDPSVGYDVVAEHLIGPATDYLTIRSIPDLAASRLSHIGFQFFSREAFMAHQQVVTQAGWQVVVGPEEIDCSLVTHFAGPDGLVHDLFHVLAPEERAAPCD